MYCRNCGSEVSENQNYCRECGEAIEGVSDSSNVSSIDLNKNNTAKDGDGLSDVFQDNWKLIAGVLVVVLILGAIGSNGDVAGGGEIEVQISYGGSWQGAISTSGSSRTISGTGTRNIQIDSGASIVSANAQKMDSGRGVLTVTIVEGGDIVAEESTSAPFGVAQVSANL